MYQCQNPFIGAAVQHFQTVIGESGRAANNSQALVAACDEILAGVQAGNLQGTLAAAQNARNLAAQLTDSTRMLNQAVLQHFERASFLMGKIQSRINDVAGALQQVRMTGLAAGTYTYPNPWQAPWQGVSPWHYGAGWQTQQMPLLM
ncbi:MAG: hypothetical protein M0Z41_07970 [Peptococcaceae bacterium]|jgi:hypothetical protein|nr:hypothetical protein [Peptococcaceae bacterium]